MKTTFTTDSYGRVTIAYDEQLTGERITRTFTCQPQGGYVWEIGFRDGNRRQVCDQLSGGGNTLSAGGIETLIKVIRREYRAMRAAEKREAARYL